MAQWRKTFDSLGGPTYITDPRVDEQARLGELLLARQRLAGDQQDRLFGRRQQLEQDQTRLAEGRRQFDMELAQRQAEARQRADMTAAETARAQANADRAFGLDQQGADLAKQRLAQQDEQSFREQAARDSIFYAAREDEKRRQLEAEVNRIDANARANEGERRADKRLAQQNAIETQREVGRDSRQAAREKAMADRQAAEIRASEERQRAQIEAQARLAQEREQRLRDQDRADREKEQGSAADRRKWAIQAREARFRAALAEETKKGALAEGDQAKAVRNAYAAAVAPEGLDPQRRTFEAAALGEDGEAEANAKLAAIVAEVFPATYSFEELPFSDAVQQGGFLNGLSYPLEVIADALTPAPLQDWIARQNWLGGAPRTGPGRPWKYGSGGLAESERLFGKKPPADTKAARQHGNVSR